MMARQLHTTTVGTNIQSRQFTSFFQRKVGENMVYGPIAVALIACFVALFRGWPLALAFAGAAGLMAVHYAPMLKSRTPQLEIDLRGVSVDGLGFIPWAAIRKIELRDNYIRTMRDAQLLIQLNAPLGETVQRTRGQPLLRGLQTHIWRKAGDKSLRLKLVSLNDEPEEIHAAALSFSTRA